MWTSTSSRQTANTPTRHTVREAFHCGPAAKLRASAPYDPVAVLEAMRARGFSFSLEADSYEGAGYKVVFDGTYWHLYHDSIALPDFTSAVRWLHQQAAAADKTFAEKLPVSE